MNRNEVLSNENLEATYKLATNKLYMLFRKKM